MAHLLQPVCLVPCSPYLLHQRHRLVQLIKSALHRHSLGQLTLIIVLSAFDFHDWGGGLYDALLVGLLICGAQAVNAGAQLKRKVGSYVILDKLFLWPLLRALHLRSMAHLTRLGRVFVHLTWVDYA